VEVTGGPCLVVAIVHLVSVVGHELAAPTAARSAAAAAAVAVAFAIPIGLRRVN
jgi:hypothetical protein